MKRILYLFFLLSCKNAFTQAPQIQWQHCIGGTSDETASTIIPLAGGNFLMVGTTSSTNGVSIHNHGNSDILVCMFDSSGIMVWRKCFGGAFNEYAYSAVQCSDGGFIIAGTTNSFDGDVTGFHFSSNADPDGWVIKLSSAGNIEWKRCLGGSTMDEIHSVLQLSDGNFLCCGSTLSHDGDVSGNHDSANLSTDAWLVKLNPSGNIIWQKCFGGSGNESANSVIETSDHHYVFAGYASLADGDVYNYHGGYRDVWLGATDAAGNLLLSKCFGGGDWDEATSLVRTIDGGFFIAGITTSNDGDVTGYHQNSSFNNDDWWLIKTDSAGNILWTRCAGGFNSDYASSGMQTADGGFMVIGLSDSYDGDVTNNYGAADVWLVRLDPGGNILWQQNYGGTRSDWGVFVTEKDGSFLFAASTYSDSIDVSFNNGSNDIWIVKLSSPVDVGEINSPGNFLTIAPNPAHGKISVSLNTSLDKNSILEARIYDDRGSLLIEKNLINTVSFYLPVENLPGGIYFLKVQERNSQRYFSEKFIIE